MGALVREMYEFLAGIPWSEVWPFIILCILSMVGWAVIVEAIDSDAPIWMVWLIIIGGIALFGLIVGKFFY